MCRLVDVNVCGENIKLAESKVSTLKKYLYCWPCLESIDRVYLFGKALTTECTDDTKLGLLYVYNNRREYLEDTGVTLMDMFPDSVKDEAVSIPNTGKNAYFGDIKDILERGKIVYERPGSSIFLS